MAWSHTALSRQIHTLIEKLADAEAISLKSGVKFTTVKNEITYGAEVTFSSADARSDSKTYSYNLFKDQAGKVIASSWNTKIDNRPGFLWKPILATQDSYPGPLRDMLDIAAKCKGLPEVSAAGYVKTAEGSLGTH
jgi:hypothetical protein